MKSLAKLFALIIPHIELLIFSIKIKNKSLGFVGFLPRMFYLVLIEFPKNV